MFRSSNSYEKTFSIYDKRAHEIFAANNLSPNIDVILSNMQKLVHF